MPPLTLSPVARLPKDWLNKVSIPIQTAIQNAIYISSTIAPDAPEKLVSPKHLLIGLASTNTPHKGLALSSFGVTYEELQHGMPDLPADLPDRKTLLDEECGGLFDADCGSVLTKAIQQADDQGVGIAQTYNLLKALLELNNPEVNALIKQAGGESSYIQSKLDTQFERWTRSRVHYYKPTLA